MGNGYAVILDRFLGYFRQLNLLLVSNWHGNINLFAKNAHISGCSICLACSTIHLLTAQFPKIEPEGKNNKSNIVII